ncbi:MAG: putative ABC transporter permease [Lachnospiraceae bacterium]|nr:putative ABC transporter permease [Lachnospiraceae bacterium]
MNQFSFLKKCIKCFLLCGAIGWLLECFWTGLYSTFQNHNYKFLCKTSFWMFPIYGMAAIILPFSRYLKKYSFLLRGFIYTILIYIAEFTTGSLLRKWNVCPWDYSNAPFHILGLIRPDYAPLWFFVGLMYEKVLSCYNDFGQKESVTPLKKKNKISGEGSNA